MMTPDTLIIDRSFKGVGRIKRHTGTTVPAVRAAISKMLTHLAHHMRQDILRAIKRGTLDLMQVYEAYQRQALHELPTAETIKPLVKSMQGWIEQLEEDAECSVKHAASLRTSLGYLEEERPKAAVHELPELIKELRTSLGRSHPRSFNLVRAAALAFVRDTLQRNDPLWAAISAVRLRKVARQAPRALLTPARMQELFPAVATDPVDAIAWGMVTTGMHASEYWGRWAIGADRVHIEGTKRKARVRDVPLVLAPAVPTMHRRTWENKVRDRTLDVQPYDLRRAYIQWLEEAGVPRTRRKLYLGHGAGDTTDLYERKEVAEFLAADAAKLRAFLEIAESAPAPAVLRRA